MNARIPQRDLAIDWLRVFAMLMVFLFHCGRFFDEGWWHVKNNQLDFGITIFVRINILRYLFGLKIDRNAAGKRHI